MSKIRNSDDGRYISPEKAVQIPASKWTEETDFDKNKFLQQVYDNLEANSETFGFISGEVKIVRLAEVENILKKFGLKN